MTNNHKENTLALIEKSLPNACELIPRRVEQALQDMSWLATELRICREALEFYADPTSHSADAGIRAREALTGIDPVTKLHD